MRTVDLQRKWDMTLLEVESRREKESGYFTTQAGIWVPNKRGKLLHELTDLPVKTHNLIVNEGLDHVLNVELNALAALTTWFLTGFSDNITPLATHDYAVDGVTEITVTDVAEAIRETFNANAASGQSLDNVAGPVAQYTCDIAFTFFGAMLKAGNSAFTDVTDDAVHILFCSSLLAPAVALVALATIDITYTIASSDV